MKYCQKCGFKISRRKDHFVCTACHMSYYDNPKATVAVVFIDSAGRIVLATRAHNPMKGFLDCIGGFLEVGETFEVGATREIEEEAGLNRNEYGPLTYLGSIHNFYDWKGDQISVTSVYFIAKLLNDAQLKPADDVASIVCLRTDELPDDKACAWPGMRDMLVKATQLIDRI